ncbi:hypothetical protein Tco_0157783 [Tanacetum coccineum]
MGVTEEQSDEETSQHPDWFQKPTKIPTLDRDWNKTLLVVHGPVQPYLVELEYFFEEVYKATTDQLDWHNPEVILMQLPSQRPRLQIMVISNGLKIWSPTQSGVKESARDVYSKRRIIAVTKL